MQSDTIGFWPKFAKLAPKVRVGPDVSNLAGSRAGVGGSGNGEPLTDYLNGYRPALGYFAIFGCDGVLFLLSTVSLLSVKGARLS